MFRRVAASISLFTRIPVSQWVNLTPADYRQTAAVYPVVGWIVGGLSALAFYTLDLIFTQPVTVALTMVFSVLLTGGLQEGGLAFFFDNLSGRNGRRIYNNNNKYDKYIGIQGVLGVTLSLLLQFALLQELSPALVPWLIVAGDSFSRFLAITLIDTNHYLRPKSGHDGTPVFKNLGVEGWFVAAILGITPLFLFLQPKIWCALIPVIIIRIFLGIFFKKVKGEINFEECMATQQFSVITFYLGVSAIPNI